jgi:D-serine deaminase-like pyridoxal phosphate-dependent protein
MQSPDAIPSPALIVDLDRLERNISSMQAACDAVGVELWPHIKTHKSVAVLKKQLAAGAKGATCAKLGEAEAMLPSGVRRIFIAYSLADVSKARRLRELAGMLDELILAVTSEAHLEVLEKVLEAAGISVPVLMAVDTGLLREGVRTPTAAGELADRIRASHRMKLAGLYTHEGHAYQARTPQQVELLVRAAEDSLEAARDEIGEDLAIWPGCSVTAAEFLKRFPVKAVRPGAYVYGDLNLAEGPGGMTFADVALHVLATVVDRPEPDLALIDAGSKVFSSDKYSGNITARAMDRQEINVTRLSEEHGFVTGHGVASLRVGERLLFTPAHVCPAVNLADRVHVVRSGEVVDVWRVDARGRSD